MTHKSSITAVYPVTLARSRFASAVGPMSSAPAGSRTIECALLFMAIILLPLETLIPTVAGLGSSFIVFALLAGYLVIFRPQTLLRTARHSLFVAVYVLLLVGLLVESLQPFRRYEILFRIALMVAGAVLIAALCRDRRALRWSILGYLVVGVWISVLLVATSYGALKASSATDFNQGSQVRREVLDENNPLQANLNSMAITASHGAVVALVLALMAKTRGKRMLLYAAAGFCLVATFLPLSRSGIVIVLTACSLVMLTYKGRKARLVLAAVVLGATVICLVPDVAYSRLTFSTQDVGPYQEARARIYTAALVHLREYVFFGVGAGNFWRTWGYNHGWGAVGAHNCYIAVTIYWGLLGLAAFLAVVARAYKCLPRETGRDALGLALLGISVSLLLMTFVTHALYAKEFSIGLGLLAAAQSRIWSKGICQPRGPEIS